MSEARIYPLLFPRDVYYYIIVSIDNSDITNYVMLETQFTPRAGARRGETKACHWGESYSTKRKQGNIEGEFLHMHSLQFRLFIRWACTAITDAALQSAAEA